MGKLKQMTPGQRMGSSMLTYIEDVPGRPRRALFACDCGKSITRPLHYVVHGSTSSCGCKKSKMVAEKNTKHGHAKMKSGAYRSWAAMKNRCACKEDYKRRAIDKSWLGEDGFKNFLRDMGERPPGMTLDRIDNSLGYSAQNCRWATIKQQANNTRSTVRIEFMGQMYTQQDLIRLFGLDYGLIKARMRRGMTRMGAFTTPINKSKSHKRVKK